MSDLTRTATAQTTRPGQSPAPSGLLQRQCACGQHTAVGGECAACRQKRQGALQRSPSGLAINRPGDRYEQEAERVAAAVLSGGELPGRMLSSSPALRRDGPPAAPAPRDPSADERRKYPGASLPDLGFNEPKNDQHVQQPSEKAETNEDRLGAAGEKLAETFLETTLGKQLTDQAEKFGEGFVSTLPGLAVSLSIAASTVATMALRNEEFPLKGLVIKLPQIAPGLKVKLTYKGPLSAPTEAGISFAYEPEAAKKPQMSDTDRTRADTERIAADQAKFQKGVKTPAERAAEQRQLDAIVRGRQAQSGNILGIPGLTPRRDDRMLQRDAAGSSDVAVAPPIVHDVLSSPGQPLDPATRSFMEPRFGHDFSGVRVHTDGRAAASARDVSANAYTVGRNIVFGAGRFAPETQEGKRLIAHELTHVVQQHETSSTALRRDADSAQPSSGSSVWDQAFALADESRWEQVAEVVNGFSPENLRYFIQTYKGQPSKIVQLHLGAIGNQKVGPNSQVARATRATYLEINFIEEIRKSNWSRAAFFINSFNPDDIRVRLKKLETEKLRALHEGAATNEELGIDSAAAKVSAEVLAARSAQGETKALLLPTVRGEGKEALLRETRVIDGIKPSATVNGGFTMTVDGQPQELTASQADEVRKRTASVLKDHLRAIENKASSAADRYQGQSDVDRQHWIVAPIVKTLGRVKDPGPDLMAYALQASRSVKSAREAIGVGNLSHAAELMATGEASAVAAMKMWQAYFEGVIGTAEMTVTVLEITRDAAFATVLALGAVAAAPVVAAGAAGLGLTGAGATAFTAVGTGVVVGGEGALLRGGSAVGGVALVGGSEDEMLSAAKSEGWRGFKEGAATGVGGGVARSASAALRVGQSTSRVVNVARGSVAQGLGNAAGSATSAKLEGGSATDVVKSGARGFAVGTLTGPLSQGTGVIKNPVAGGVARMGEGAFVSGGQAYLQTGSVDAALQSAAIGGASAMTGGMAQPGTGTTPTQQRAFRAAQSAKRAARTVLAAGMIGVAKTVPAAVTGGATVGMPNRPSQLQVEPGMSSTIGSTSKLPKETRHAPMRAEGVELDRRPQEVRQVNHNEIDTGNLGETGKPLELDRGTQPTRAVAFNELTEVDMQTKAAGVASRNQFGAPSTERGGTEARTGMQFHEFNAAEVAMRLRTDYDPVAGRPRKVSYWIDGQASSARRQTDRLFGPDETIEGRQPRHDSFTNTGLDRGHMTPRQAGRGDPDVERSLDLTTVVVPQTPASNRGAGSLWRAGEQRAMQWAVEFGRVQVEVEILYGPNPQSLPDGTPIPRGFRRTIAAPDGTILEDITHLNQ